MRKLIRKLLKHSWGLPPDPHTTYCPSPESDGSLRKNWWQAISHRLSAISGSIMNVSEANNKMPLLKDRPIEGEIINIKSDLADSRKKLEDLHVNGEEEEIFQQELISNLESISLKLDNIKKAKNNIKSNVDIVLFLQKVAKEYGEIKEISLRISSLSIRFEEHEIVNLIASNYFTNSVILAFAICNEVATQYYKFNKNTEAKSLAILLHEYSEMLQLSKEERDNSSKKHIHKNLAFFTSVILDLNHKVSNLEEKIDKKNKGFGKKKTNYYSTKEIINKTKTELINILFSVISLVANNKQDIVIIIKNIDYKIYRHFADSLNENPWCRVSYIHGVLKLVAVGIKHENINRNINSLIEKYCDDQKIQYKLIGSTEFRGKESGKQPDSGYLFSKKSTKPDLALEVNVTSGSEEDLVLYEELGVKEVWIWNDKKNNLTFYLLGKEGHKPIKKSYFLEKITPEIIKKYLLLIQEDDFNLSFYKEKFISEVNSNAPESFS